MKKAIYISILCLINTIVIGQASNFLTNDFVLPPPEATSFMKFIDQPVDYFSGTTPINIPIHTVTDGSLSVPITLSYHTGGVRVDEIAGWTGINWNLSVGGNLSRTIRGIADELDGELYQGYQITGNMIANGGVIFDDFFDTEADIFSYTAGSYSGKFYFDKDGEAIMIKGESVKVEPFKIYQSPHWNKFIITTPDGNRFIFGIYDGRSAWQEQWTTSPLSGVQVNEQKTSSVFHIMAIENHNGDHKIEYFYNEESYTYPQKKTCSYRTGTIWNSKCSKSSIPPIPCESGDPDDYFIQNIDGYKLSKIVSHSETVNFRSKSGRDDLDLPEEGGSSNEADFLETISIDNGVKKNVSFYYSYFNDPSGTKSYHKRLRLDYIQESSGDKIIPPYTFEYHSDFLPHRFSKSTDHWGFYNGQPNNSDYNIPFSTITTPDGNISFGNADRSTYSQYVNTGMLTKITYPTGGYKSFIYENHSSYTESFNSEKEFTIKDCGNEPFIENICNINQDPSKEKIFSQKEIESAFFDINLQYFIPGLETNSTALQVSGKLSFKPPSGPSKIITIPLNVPANSGSIDINKKVYLNEVNGLLDNINYVVSIEFSSNLGPEYGWAEAGFHNFPLKEVTVGGTRISKIITDDGYAKYERSFKYITDNNISSGLIYQKPVYGFNNTQGNNVAGFSLNIWSDAVLFPYNSYSGYYIGYKQVIEHTEQSGKIIRKYHAAQNLNLKWPLIPTQLKVRHGKMIKARYLDVSEDVVKNIDNSFQSYQTLTPYDYGMYAVERIGNIPCTANGTNIYANTPYNPTQIVDLLTKEISIEDNVEVITNYNYNYNQSGHIFPTSITTCDSDNKCYTQRTKYLNGYSVNSTVQDYFKSKNMLLPAWETIKTKGENQNLVEISGSRTRWSSFGGKFYPYLFQTLNDDGTWKEMASISEYNTDGFPEKLHRRQKAMPIDLTWKSGSQYGLLDQIKEHQRIIDYGYDGGRKVKSILDNNSIESNFEYDAFKRLDFAESNNKKIKVDYEYNYGLAYSGENTISNTISYLDGTESQETQTVFDGFGRKIQERRLEYLQSGEDYILSQEYNELGQIVSSLDPGSGGTTTFEREASPLNRVTTTNPAGTDATIVNSYGTNSLVIGGYSSNTLYKSSVTDENGNISTTFTDIFGRQIATIQDEGGENLMTVYTYNDKDQILSIQPPVGSPYIYTYYPDGLLWTKTIPEKGTTTYIYNDYDQIWKETLPNGKVLEYVYNADYNSFLEAVKLDNQIIKSYEPDDPNLIKEWIKKESQAIHFSAGIMQNGHVTEYLDYDYNFGRPQLIDVTTLDGTSTTTLTYDYPGNVTSSTTTISGPDYEDRTITNEPTYHKGIRQVTNLFDIGDLTIGVDKFKYDSHDWLRRKTLHKNIQGIDYEYNDRGWLKSINTVADTYIDNDPCKDGPIISTDVDCDKLIDIIQTFVILYNCQEISTGTPTALKIKKSTQYFEGSSIANAVTSNEYEIPISGGLANPTNSLPDSISFTLNGGISDEDFSGGLIELLIDCINGNTQILNQINQAIQDVSNTTESIAGGVIVGNANETVSNSKDDVFGMEIHYEDGNSELSAPPQYNGNISWIEWRSKTDQRHAYGFQYDGVNRLGVATYGEDKKSTKECKIEKSDKYSVPFIKYNALGDIQYLYRNGLQDPSVSMSDYGLIDGLAYTYSNGTNGLLMNVTDESSQQLGFRGPSSTYGYDGTGNLTSDSQKGITDILYSYNDLPLKIETDNGDIFNWYTSDGLKVKSKVVPSGPAVANPPVTTNYINSAEYKDNTLESIYVDEGRVVFQKTEGTYVEYFLKDHLGNTRVRIADKNGDHLVNVDSNNPEKDELMNIRHYYPFGMEWDTPLEDENGGSLDASGVKNKYSYNGKELIDDLDINLHDYGARMYDPAIARFTTVDRFAEKYAPMSGYQYGGLNPINTIDINGDSLQVMFTGEAARNAFIGLVNKGLEGQFTANISDSGIVTFAATEGGGDVSKMSKNGQAFYNSTSGVLNSKNTVSITADYGNGGVHTGHFDSGTIDMADIMQFNENPNQLGATQLGKLTHEIVEQGEKQLYGSGFGGAHSDAIAAENGVNNSIRSKSDGYTAFGATQKYSRGDRSVTTKIDTYKRGGWRDFFMKVNRKIIKVTNR